MAQFFYWIFKLTGAHKIIAGSILLGIILLAVFTASRIRLEENIINIIPHDEGVVEINQAFEGLSMNNRLVVHLYYEDTTAVAPDTLISIATQLADSLQATSAPFIAEIIKEFPDSEIELLYNYYYENLPFYLQPQDYQQLEKRVNPEGISTAVNKFYKSLLSPMGMVTKKMLVKDPLGLTSFPLERVRDLRLDDNFSLYKNHILTNDHKHLIFLIALANPPNETSNNGKLIANLNQLVEEMGRVFPGVNIEYFGTAAVAVANASRMKQDIYLTVTLVMVALFLFISFFYRKLSTFFIVITPGAFGALVAVAVLTLVKEQVSVISLAVGSVLLGITIDYALHLFTHYKKEKDIRQLFADLAVPTFMSSLTTSCAFFSLLFIRSTALQDLGIFAGVSVLAAALYTLIVLPHFAVSEKENKAPKRKKNAVEKAVTALAAYPLHKSKWALILFFVFTAVSVFTWRNFSFESNMLGLNYMPENLAQYEKNINAISTFTANNIYLAATGKNFQEALEANVMVDDTLRQLEQAGKIYGYLTLNKIVPSPGVQQQRLQQWKSFWQTHEKDTVLAKLKEDAARLGFKANTFNAFDSLLHQNQPGLDQEDVRQILSVFGEDLIINNADGSVSVISSIKLAAEDKPKVLEQLAALPGVVMLDKGYLTSRLIVLLKEDFNKLVNISLGVVFLIILLSYGRLELALIAFVPIMVSWLWVLGLMGLFGLSFNIVNVIICTFIFGLGVDYSIFVMNGLVQGYKFGLDNLLSYKKSIILSAVTTLTGIGVLAFAEHPALRSIAFLAIIGIVSVIFITFTLEQVLFDFLIGNRKKKGVIPFTLASLFFTIIAFSYFLFGCFLLFILRILFLLPLGSLKKRKYVFHWVMMIFCRSLIYTMFNFKKEVVNRELANYEKPAVIISNHHSFIDILIMLMFHPKVVMVTNDWVYYSPFFGKSVQYADFIQASQGVENQLGKIQKLVDDGFSIVVFPEGTRTGSFELKRFHKGAFYLADQFKLDIQPILLHGTSLVMPKGDDFYLKNNLTTIQFLPRIKHDDASFGTTYTERAKKISEYFKKEYQKLRLARETPRFFKDILIKNYLYKGPVLEWYLKIKFRLEEEYELFHALVPHCGRIVDLGCGYGFITFALGLSSTKREMVGIDYDEEKIKVAQECPVKPPNIDFAQGDVVKAEYGQADVFLIADVLHYLTPEEQQQVLIKMAKHLNEGGRIIIRDGDKAKEERHKGTKLTEIFSTGIGFNKTRNTLNYISGDMIVLFARQHNFELEIIDNTKRTSNLVFVLKSKNEQNGKL